MKRILTLLLVVLQIAGAAERATAPPSQRIERRPRPGTSKEAAPPVEKSAVRFEGGDGTSAEKAVIIKGAKDSQVGIRAEYEWAEKKYPGCRRKGQSLHNERGKTYDVLTVVTKDGKEIDVHFDITDFFAKF